MQMQNKWLYKIIWFKGLVVIIIVFEHVTEYYLICKSLNYN